MQLSVLVPNLVLDAAKNFIGRERAFKTKHCLVLIGNLRLCCKAWKMIVDSTVEYNVLLLAAHEHSMVWESTFSISIRKYESVFCILPWRIKITLNIRVN